MISIRDPRLVKVVAAAMRERLLEEKETETMGKKREAISLKPVEYKVRRGTVVERVVLTGAFCQCTKCGGIKPMSEFGFRVEQGVLRNQAQCKDCR